MIAGVYGIENTLSKNMYVGSSSNVLSRWIQHKADLRRRKHHCDHLQKAWNKYGQDVFVFFLIEKCEAESLMEREQYWIDVHKKRLYNGSLVAGRPPSTKGIPKSAEHNRKNREAHLGEKAYWYGKKGVDHPTFGRHHTKESIEKNRKAHLGKSPANKGKPMSKEQKEKLSRVCKGRVSPNKGKHVSEEQKQKQSMKMKGKLAGEKNPMYDVHRFGENSPHFGRRNSEASLERMRLAQRRRWMDLTDMGPV